MGRSGMAWAMLGAGAVALVLAGCEKYKQDSPAAVLTSARAMVEDGNADRLSDLLYAESPEMRRIYNKLGKTFGSMAELATAVQERFPDEVNKMRLEAEEAAKNGKASSLLAQLVTQGQGGRPRRPQGSEQDMRASFDRTIKEVFADPFGWLQRSEGRISTIPLTDDTAAITWDGKPLFPPVGLTMRLEKGRWYIVPPTNLLGATGILPKTPDEYRVWERLVQAVDNAVVDMEKDVKGGKVNSLRQVAEDAGEKAFIPVAIVVLAYGKMVDERETEARQAREAAEAAKAQPAPAPAGEPK